MTRSGRTRLVETILFLFVLATAAGARVGYLMAYADEARTEGPLRVQDRSPELPLVSTGSQTEQEWLIDNVRQHGWFGSLAPLADQEERTAHAAPGYPWLVAQLQRLPFDLGPVDVLVRWLQCGLGALTAGLYFFFGRWAFGSRTVGVLAGLLCALHPFWIVNTAQIGDGVLASFLLACVLCLGVLGGRTGEPLASLLYGVALAALALVRAALLPFALAALLWYLWRCRSLAQGWLAALLAFLGLVLGLTPWTLRNLDAFQDAYPVVDSTYYHLWMGNNPKATGGPLPEDELLAALAEYRKADPQQTAIELAALPQPNRYRELASPMVAELARDPAAACRRRIWAGLYFFFGEDWFTQNKLYQTSRTAAPVENSLYPGLLVGSLFAMLLLGALGWRWTFARGAAAMPSALAILLVPLPYILGHAEALSGPRLPLDGVLLTYAAFVLALAVPGRAGKLLRGKGDERDQG